MLKPLTTQFGVVAPFSRQRGGGNWCRRRIDVGHLLVMGQILLFDHGDVRLGRRLTIGFDRESQMPHLFQQGGGTGIVTPGSFR